MKSCGRTAVVFAIADLAVAVVLVVAELSGLASATLFDAWKLVHLPVSVVFDTDFLRWNRLEVAGDVYPSPPTMFVLALLVSSAQAGVFALVLCMAAKRVAK